MPKILLTIADITTGGGTERVVVNLANMLVELGYEVEILSFFGARDLCYGIDERVRLTIMYKQSEENFMRRRGLAKYYVKYLFKVVLSVRMWWRYRVDCIISNDWTFTPFVIHRHTRYIKVLHLNFTRYNKRNSYFDTLVLLSHTQSALYRPFHPHIKVIPNFLPTLPTQTTDYTQKIVLSVGRMDSGDQKGFFRLIDIWEMVVKQTQTDSQNGWQLHIVGDGVLRQELQKTIQSKGLQDSIILKPFTKDIEQEYLNASIYVMSSHNEGFGMVLIESASYGLPAIAFDIATGPSDIILDSHTGYLIADNDLQAYADKLQTLMRDEALRENLGRQAKERVAECFSKEAIARVWEEVLVKKS